VLLYTKFSVFAQAQRWGDAELCLRSLLRETKSFETALSMVKTYVEGNRLSVNDSAALFRLLSDKFPQEPHFSEIRLCNLQTLLSSSSSSSSTQGKCLQGVSLTHNTGTGTGSTSMHGSDHFGSFDAVALSITIIREHRSGVRALTPEHYQRLKHVLLERVSWARIADHPGEVLEWSGCLLRLLDGDDSSSSSSSGGGGSGIGTIMSTVDLQLHGKMFQDKKFLSLSLSPLCLFTR
jgi:hypothetical protein